LRSYLADNLEVFVEMKDCESQPLGGGGNELVYTYDTQGERTGITTLLDDLRREGIGFRDLKTTQSSLEEIFVKLVEESR
jgi:ABC-2 type transport system ATP-binding protein